MNEWLKQKEMLEQKVRQKLSYPYLHKYIEKPEIEESRLLILMMPFTAEQLLSDDIQNCIVSAALIQIALDTHERVIASSDYIAKDQQLTVLAGDYFSGLYYRTLAETGNIDMIRSLSAAVKSINESKIALYHQEHDSVSSIMESVYKIETEIIKQFYSVFDLQSFFPVVSHVLSAKRLIEEKHLFVTGEKSVLAEAVDSLEAWGNNPSLSVDGQHEMISICDQYINHAKAEVEQALHDRSVAGSVRELCSLLYNETFRNKTYPEEG